MDELRPRESTYVPLGKLQAWKGVSATRTDEMEEQKGQKQAQVRSQARLGNRKEAMDLVHLGHEQWKRGNLSETSGRL